MTPECLKNKSHGGREMDGRKLYEKPKSCMCGSAEELMSGMHTA